MFFSQSKERIRIFVLKHILGHLWQKYSVICIQIMIAFVKRSKVLLRIQHFEPHSFHTSSNPLPRKLGNVWTERCILDMESLVECCFTEKKSTQWKYFNHIFCQEVSYISTNSQKLFLNETRTILFSFSSSLVCKDVFNSHQTLIYSGLNHSFRRILFQWYSIYRKV